MTEPHVTVRFWAGAKAAAGTDQMLIGAPEPLSLEQVRRAVLTQVDPGARAHLEQVIANCSVLVDGLAIDRTAPESVRVGAGQSVEMLPPFAGG